MKRYGIQANKNDNKTHQVNPFKSGNQETHI